MDFSLITSAVSAINGAIDLGRGALSIRDEAKAMEIVQAMNEKLLDAQQRLFELGAAVNALQHENFEATRELRELKEVLAERGRYSLVEISPGQFAYKTNPAPALFGTSDPAFTQPDHYICQQCFDGPSKTKVVLQRRFFMGGVYQLTCPSCKSTWVGPQ
ncbi:hypothetical protein LP085_08635 [Achromobacter sp. MY14]|uniref:hypothetical protein n=1 Tax=unclassified Achromobacter TaxID=2626865 RepID=UPI001E610AFC|nr:hypothetical protein [Achromobacter sp. MY14]MCD0496910.1 hypothetical protein [Achromobacter sp. MY14]